MAIRFEERDGERVVQGDRESLRCLRDLLERVERWPNDPHVKVCNGLVLAVAADPETIQTPADAYRATVTERIALQG